MRASARQLLFGMLSAGGASISLTQNQGMHCDSDGSNYTCVLGVGAGGGSGTVTSVGAGYGIFSGTITASGTHAVSLPTASNTLASDVSLSNTSSYFDGLSMAQGSTGVWFACGSVDVQSVGSNDGFYVKLWDWTTFAASKTVFTNVALPSTM